MLALQRVRRNITSVLYRVCVKTLKFYSCYEMELFCVHKLKTKLSKNRFVLRWAEQDYVRFTDGRTDRHIIIIYNKSSFSAFLFTCK